MKKMILLGILALALVFGMVFIGCDDGGNNFNNNFTTLTVNGIPADESWSAFIFAGGTDVSSWDKIITLLNAKSYQAIGSNSSTGDNNFTIYGWDGNKATGAWTGSGNFQVVMSKSGSTVTVFKIATINFTNGYGSTNLNSFTDVVYSSGGGNNGGGNNGGDGGTTNSKLTINDLPSGTYAAYVFTTGTDISTYQAIINAYNSGSYQAVGATVTAGNSFTLVGWNGTAATTAWTGSGNLPVLLLNATGSITDTGNSMYSYATINFSNGSGTASFGNFTAVVMGGSGDNGGGDNGGGDNGGGDNGGGEPASIEMVTIPTGTLTWGSATITLSAFSMSKYTVTQDQYQAVMGLNPSDFNSSPAAGEEQGKRPVETVTWYDAIEFCNKLSEKEELTPVYTIIGRSPATGYPITSATVTANWSANGYRLPTEAQWEYACRAGSTTDWYFGSSVSQLGDYAWYSSNSNNITHEVGKKQPNAFGLYDMHGNVWEWCWDWHGSYPATNQTDYTGAGSGSVRVYRGGNWNDSLTEYTKSSFRGNYFTPDTRNGAIGFRVVRSNGDHVNPGTGGGTENTLSINYANGGGSGSAPSNPVSVVYGSSITMPANTYTRTGYTFSGWAVSGSDSISGTYAAGATVAVADLSSAIANGNASITLTASWTINSYTVTFNTNGGSSINPQTVNHGTAVTQPINPTKSGYGFIGWYSDAGLTTIYNFTTQITGAVTIYAKWGTLAASAQDIADFGSGAGIADTFNVSNSTEWNSARDNINNNGDGKNYIINITDNFAILGTTSNSFTPSQIVVSVRGNYTISLSSNGNILRIASNQKIIIHDLTLKGRRNGVDGAAEDNSNSLINNYGILELKGTSAITGNTYYSTSSASGGGVNNNGTLTMWENSSISNNVVKSHAPQFTTVCVAQGGGIFNSGSFILRGNVSITENSANVTKDSSNNTIQSINFVGQGGGIYNNRGGIIYIENGNISSNSATSAGSQLYQWKNGRDGTAQDYVGTQQYGTFDSNGNWTKKGDLSDIENYSITVTNGNK